VSKSSQIPRAASNTRSPGIFFALVFALTIPFWGISGLTRIELLPGLPIAAFAVICPAIAALALVFREAGVGAMSALGRRVFDGGRVRPPYWYALVLLINPIIALLSFATQRLNGAVVPPFEIDLVQTLALAAVFFVAALAEELGWSGYATEPIQARFGAAWGGLLLGAVWAAWHFIPLLQVGRSAEWIAWWALGTVSARVIMVCLYNRTGMSVFAIALYHASSNLCWQLYPSHGSAFDPQLNGLITTAIAVAAVFLARKSVA